VAVDDFISPAEARARLLQIRERIQSGEDFAELAQAHSGDPVSSAKGGDLGWLAPGDTVRPFEQVMDTLEVGEISDPVRTPFGMHIIQVLERRTQEMGEELVRNDAREQIRARKSDERYARWLRQLRDESYVELRYESLSSN
jgi:peptidyl-prolyl cis-trans isomerase SurA